MFGSKSLRKLCLTAMLMSLSVVIGIVCKNFLTWGIYYRVTFENLPIILIGFCFGPFYGMAAGAGADVISCLCSINPMVNPVITLGAAAVGFLSGLPQILFGRKKSDSENLDQKKRLSFAHALILALSVFPAHLIGQWLIKSIAKITMLGMPPIGMLIGLGITAVVAPVEYFLLRIILSNRSIASSLEELSDYELR
ncbi:MAG: folate family ECF transporter S component [Clostridia bacterium]|nr:folate family ECF transporter S component [Clostridia bacterium]